MSAIEHGSATRNGIAVSTIPKSPNCRPRNGRRGLLENTIVRSNRRFRSGWTRMFSTGSNPRARDTSAGSMRSSANEWRRKDGERDRLIGYAEWVAQSLGFSNSAARLSDKSRRLGCPSFVGSPVIGTDSGSVVSGILIVGVKSPRSSHGPSMAICVSKRWMAWATD